MHDSKTSNERTMLSAQLQHIQDPGLRHPSHSIQAAEEALKRCGSQTMKKREEEKQKEEAETDKLMEESFKTAEEEGVYTMNKLMEQHAAEIESNERMVDDRQGSNVTYGMVSSSV